MKKNNIFKIALLSTVILFNTGCEEEKFLKEVPLDFYSPENSFITPGNFEAALTDLYAKVRAIQSVDGGASLYSEVLGTDLAFNARLATDRMGSYAVGLTPQSSIPTQHWLRWYKVIGNANTIISRAEKATGLNDTQKKAFGAEAKFFRAFAYNKLVNLFGGVPLILEEVASPKTDFVRASKEDILKQIISDAADAAANLPAIEAVKDGKVSKPAANHLLAEAYIQVKDYDKAIAAATEVIEKSNLKLMTDRFGSLKSQPGDAFYDLFRVGNQNRKIGNTEGIWVIQYENDVIGGSLTSAGGPVNNLERVVSPAVFSLVAPDGKSSLLDNLSASTLNSGGRGVSFVQPTNYWTYDIWGLDPKKDNRKLDSTVTDIRTSRFNIVRDFTYTNPASLQFGKSIIDFPATNWIPAAQKWRWYPYPSKVTTPGQHPTGLYQDAAKLTLKSVAGQTYRDMYMIRLPETILLRAEAHLLKGNTAQAAADINLVRNRAKAKPATADEITLDYILDERARELIFEEDRRHTLSRMGKLVERAKKYNALSGPTIQPFHALFPIPFAEIQANKDAVLEQNPGY